VAGTGCELCDHIAGEPLLVDPDVTPAWRAILVDDPHIPGFCRVIAARHAREMTDLPVGEQRRLLDAVLALETAVREVIRPQKINLASLGNMTPHVHWHVIPRWEEDRWFPGAIWAAQKREAPERPRPPDLARTLRAAFRAAYAAR
jgi:diadenosine tetraphosphate (Ap4A) HIT family hydrolase